MKRETIKKLLAVAGCVTIFCAIDVTVSAAATTATATTTGQVIAAVQITKTADLEFGKIIAGAAATKVSVAAAGTISKDTGDAVLYGGTVSAAKFHVVGDGTTAYTVTLPASFQVDSGGNHMTVDTIVTDQADLTALQGTVDINVGATLNVGATQASGTYTSTTGLVANVAYN